MSSFFLPYPFDVEVINKKHYTNMIKTYYDKIGTVNGYNVLYDDIEYNEVVTKKFVDVVQTLFDITPPLNSIKTWIYVQNSKDYNSVWHNHIRTASLNGTFYINLPKVGGKLEIFEGGSTQIDLEPKTLYLFPGWMYHRPLPQIDEEYRVCVNVEYYTDVRPLCNVTNLRW